MDKGIFGGNISKFLIIHMRNEIIGIIAEGAEDIGFLRVILQAFQFDKSEVIAIRPQLATDATDRHINTQTIGTFQGVKNSCKGVDNVRPDFEQAFSIVDFKHMVIHLDTAEIDIQGVSFCRPNKIQNPEYSKELRELIINEINEWLNNNYSDQLLYAITIEEIEAWCLAGLLSHSTNHMLNLKHKLATELDRKNMSYRDFQCDTVHGKALYFEKVGKKLNFHKLAFLKRHATKNDSLMLFVESLEKLNTV